MRILFLGFGYTARRLAPRLAASAHALSATTRDPARARALEAAGVEPVPWAPEAPADLAAGIARADAILISVPPEEGACPAFAATHEAIAARARDLAWVGYLSSNGVYGDHAGAWVDEDSELRPASPRARARVAAEAAWAGHAVEWAYPLIIFRLPGIYGPGRSAFDQLRAGRAQRVVKPGQVFNRMHVDDIARCLEASLARPGAGDLFNLSDDEPAPPQDVITYAAELLGVAPPPLVRFEDAALSEMARSFYEDNKRVRNDRAKRALGVDLLHPTYREGLAAILAEERGRR